MICHVGPIASPPLSWVYYGIMSKKSILAYLAGVIDSDGTIGIKRNTYSMRVTGDSTQPVYSERVHIRQVSMEALSLFAETFGGNVRPQPASSSKGKPLFRWGVTDRQAVILLRAILPFLRIKKAQALNCLELRRVKEASRKARVAKGRGHVGASCRPKEISEQMESLYLRAKQLNKTGI